MHHLERRLHARDMDARTSHPFDWGLSFLDRVPEGSEPLAALRAYNAASVAESDRYFAPPPATADAFDFDGHNLRFPSSIAGAFSGLTNFSQRNVQVRAARDIPKVKPNEIRSELRGIVGSENRSQIR